MLRTTKPKYDCSRCPAYCCSYERIEVTEKDVARIAEHFEMPLEEALRRYTRVVDGERIFRHKKDHVYKSVCVFLDRKTRGCTIYKARPKLCRTYPEEKRCGYWEFLAWERERHDDEEFIPMQ